MTFFSQFCRNSCKKIVTFCALIFQAVVRAGGLDALIFLLDYTDRAMGIKPSSTSDSNKPKKKPLAQKNTSDYFDVVDQAI